jgi:hypothetical protein
MGGLPATCPRPADRPRPSARWADADQASLPILTTRMRHRTLISPNGLQATRPSTLQPLTSTPSEKALSGPPPVARRLRWQRSSAAGQGAREGSCRASRCGAEEAEPVRCRPCGEQPQRPARRMGPRRPRHIPRKPPVDPEQPVPSGVALAGNRARSKGLGLSASRNGRPICRGGAATRPPHRPAACSRLRSDLVSAADDLLGADSHPFRRGSCPGPGARPRTPWPRSGTVFHGHVPEPPVSLDRTCRGPGTVQLAANRVHRKRRLPHRGHRSRARPTGNRQRFEHADAPPSVISRHHGYRSHVRKGSVQRVGTYRRWGATRAESRARIAQRAERHSARHDHSGRSGPRRDPLRGRGELRQTDTLAAATRRPCDRPITGT